MAPKKYQQTYLAFVSDAKKMGDDSGMCVPCQSCSCEICGFHGNVAEDFHVFRVLHHVIW